MAISNNSTGLRTGVCTSATRPTAPYEGQHIYETDTDIEYVWNGSAWVVNYVSAASPAFTGTPTAPTATAGTNTTQLATTAFANTAGGLVFIKSQTVGSGVSSVVVSGAFNSTYDNYRIIYQGGGGSGGIYLTLQLGSTASGYFGSLFGSAYASGAFIGIGINNGANFSYAGLASTNYATMSVDLFGPNTARVTNMSSNWTFNLTSTGYSIFMGEEASTTQHTAFTIGTSSGTISGGTIIVYGYRKA